MRSQKMFGQNQKEFREKNQQTQRDQGRFFSTSPKPFSTESQVFLMYFPHTTLMLISCPKWISESRLLCWKNPCINLQVNKSEICCFKCVSKISDCKCRAYKQKLVGILAIWDTSMKIIFSLYSFCAGKPHDFILCFINVVNFQNPQPQESCCLQTLSFS